MNAEALIQLGSLFYIIGSRFLDPITRTAGII